MHTATTLRASCGAASTASFVAVAVGHERRVVLQDAALEGPELLTGLHPGLLDDREPRLLIRGQGVLPAVGAVQREHLQPAQALVRRVLADEGVELADRLSMEAELELGLEAHLLRGDALLLQAPDRVLREAPVGEVGERGPPPEPERLAECRRSLARRHRARLPHEALEAARVDRVGRDAEPVSGGRVSSASAPSSFRSRETQFWTYAGADGRGAPSQSSSMSTSSGTTSFAWRSRMATRARCFGPPRATGAPSIRASSGPSMLNSNVAFVTSGDHRTPGIRAAQDTDEPSVRAGLAGCTRIRPMRGHDCGAAINASPVASFVVEPAEPAAGEAVRLLDLSYDPAGDGIAAHAWDSATARRPSRRNRPTDTSKMASTRSDSTSRRRTAG